MNLDLGQTRLIISKCMQYGLLRNQAAYILATAYWETARTMEPVKEAFWLSEDWRENNLRYHPWYGRGFVQLTWERNYHKASRELGVDLVTDPDAAMSPDISADVLVIGARDGWFTGKRLDDYITAKQSNYRGARRVVNGTDKAAAIAEIAADYEQALVREGYGLEPVRPVVNDRRDGTAPRARPVQSKTLWAQVGQWVAMLGISAGALPAWWAEQSEPVQIAVICGAALIVVSGAVVFRERLKMWGDGVR